MIDLIGDDIRRNLKLQTEEIKAAKGLNQSALEMDKANDNKIDLRKQITNILITKSPKSN